MATRTMRFLLPEREGTAHVYKVGDRLNMRWIDAGRVPAQMIALKPFGNPADQQFVNYSVGFPGAESGPNKLPVPQGTPIGSPEPTIPDQSGNGARLNPDFASEAFRKPIYTMFP